MPTKVKMMFLFKLPANEAFLHELEQNCELLEVNEKKVIVRYKRGDVELCAPRDEGRKPQDFSDEEDRALLYCLAEKVSRIEQPLVREQTFREISIQTGGKRTTKGVRHRFHEVLSKKIHRLEEFDMETRIRMLFAMTYPMDKTFQEVVQQSAEILEIDDNGVILRYKKDDTDLDRHQKTYQKRRRTAPFSDDYIYGTDSAAMEGVIVKNENKNGSGSGRPRGRPKKVARNDENFHNLSTEFHWQMHAPQEFLNTNLSAHWLPIDNVKQEVMEEFVAPHCSTQQVKVEAVEEDFTFELSAEIFVMFLKNMVISLENNSEILGAVREKLDISIAAHRKITGVTLRFALDAILDKSFFSPEPPNNHRETTSLREFLKLLRSMVLTFNTRALDGVVAKIETIRNTMGEGDKLITIVNIVRGIEAALAVVPF
uniref:SPK domain-containing protein n=1 Tax=Caenorhabditis japonica TaxID=281687 RepID=A0A8R1HXK7_CAEJA